MSKSLDPRTGAMLAAFLQPLGFETMARECSSETDPARLQHYARIVLKQTPDTFSGKVAMKSRFVVLGLVRS